MSRCTTVRALVAATLFLASAAAAAPLIVPTEFPTIQSAVDAAPDGGTIKVLSGAYREQITITRDVTIEGVGATASFVVPPAVGKLKDFRDGLTALIRVGAKARVRISDLGVLGPLPGICDKPKLVAMGISVEEEAELRLERVSVREIRDEPVKDCLMFGIIAGFPGEAVGHVTVLDSRVEGSQGPSIVVAGPFDGSGISIGDIRENVVVGLRRPGNFDQNGITILGGAVATVAKNSVSRLVCMRKDLDCGSNPIKKFQSFGIGVFAAVRPGTFVENNLVEKNDVGIYLAGVVNCCTVRDNLIVDSRYFGIIVQDGKNELRDNTIRRGRVGVGVVGSEANAKAVLVGNEISQPKHKPIDEISCCGFEARAIVKD